MDNKITLALQNLKPAEDGKTIKGTRALIQAVQEATGFSQGRIAEIAKCSIAGVQRWLNLDSGQTSRLVHLIQYARNLAEQAQAGSNNIGQPVAVVTSFAEAVRGLRLADLEQEFRTSLQRLTGLPLEICEINKLETRDGVVGFDLRVK
ncbi:hypothetical protein [Azotobacter beijerinckii]|uniref:hypothetical protein n=1 Tax=Azotobacter beijerinckii TaxID=170623 RepID=UPI0029548EF1|nr:hypothetical protein [Azotobacter beijerinckii]MDV7213739.1 hypothetical protein [Azotobacter beijerinckii]